MIQTILARAVKDPRSTDVKLKKAAQEFEAMLLSDMLKFAEAEKQTEASAEHGFDDMRIKAVAEGISSGGGIGVARLLTKQLLTGL